MPLRSTKVFTPYGGALQKPHDILLKFNKVMIGPKYITWNCNCGNERLWVSSSTTICLKCDTEKHGFQVITDLLHEVIRGD